MQSELLRKLFLGLFGLKFEAASFEGSLVPSVMDENKLF